MNSSTQSRKPYLVLNYHQNGGGANDTPNRLSLHSHQNGCRSTTKDGKKDNTRPVAPVNYVAMSKEDFVSYVSGFDPISASP